MESLYELPEYIELCRGLVNRIDSDQKEAFRGLGGESLKAYRERREKQLAQARDIYDKLLQLQQIIMTI